MDVFALSTVLRADGGQQVIRTLEQIDRQGRQTTRTMSTLGETTRTLGGLIVPAGLQQSAAAVSRTNTETKALGGSMTSLNRTVGDVARGFAVMGTVGTRDIKNLVREGTQLAFLMGAGGPLIAGLGLAVTAIVGMHFRARKELEETEKKYLDSLEALAKAKDIVGAQDVMIERFAQIRDERAKLTRLEERSEEASERLLRVGGQGAAMQAANAAKAVEASRERIATLQREYNDHKRILDTSVAHAVSMENNRASTEAWTNAREEANKKTEEARRETERLAKELKEMNREMALHALTLSMETRERAENVFRDLDSKIGIRVAVDLDDRQLRERLARLGTTPELLQAIDTMASDMASAVSTGIAGVFQGLFSGEGLGDSLLAGLGNLFVRLGEALVVFGGLMEKLKAFFLKNPLLAGGAAIAAGLALMALGGTLAGIAGGGGGGRGGGIGGGFGGGGFTQAGQVGTFTLGSPGTVTSGMAGDAAKLRPQAPVNVTIYGNPNDLRTQRWIHEVRQAGLPRGLT